MKIENWPIDKPKPYGKNPRRNERAVGPVADSIKKFGFRQPIVVDLNGVVIVGHTRLLAAKQLKMTHVPVHVADMDENTAKAYRLVDNKTSEYAEWDNELLKLELEELKFAEVSVDGFGGILMMPDFAPSSADEQGRLDQKAKHTCPECGHEF